MTGGETRSTIVRSLAGETQEWIGCRQLRALVEKFHLLRRIIIITTTHLPSSAPAILLALLSCPNSLHTLITFSIPHSLSPQFLPISDL